MDGARDELLARPRLARDEDGRVGGRGAPDELPHGQHGGARAHEIAGHVQGGRRGRRHRGLHEGALLDGAVDGRAQRGQVEGLRDVVEGPVAHGADRPLAVAVGGRHDHGDVARRSGAQLAQEIEAVAVPQPDVQQQTVDGGRGGRARTGRAHERLARLGQAGDGDGLEAHRGDDVRQALAQAGLVLDDEHAVHARAPAACADGPPGSRGSVSSKRVTSPSRA